MHITFTPYNTVVSKMNNYINYRNNTLEDKRLLIVAIKNLSDVLVELKELLGVYKNPKATHEFKWIFEGISSSLQRRNSDVCEIQATLKKIEDSLKPGETFDAHACERVLGRIDAGLQRGAACGRDFMVLNEFSETLNTVLRYQRSRHKLSQEDVNVLKSALKNYREAIHNKPLTGDDKVAMAQFIDQTERLNFEGNRELKDSLNKLIDGFRYYIYSPSPRIVREERISMIPSAAISIRP